MKTGEELNGSRLQSTSGSSKSGVIDYNSPLGEAFEVPNVFARHSEEVGGRTVRLVWLVCLWTSNELLAKQRLTPSELCIALREALRVFDALQKDTVNTLGLVTLCKAKHPQTLRLRLAPESVNKLVSQCNDSDEERANVLARVLEVESQFVECGLPFVVDIRRLLEAKKEISHTDATLWLLLEGLAAKLHGISEYPGGWLQSIRDNLEALDFVLCAIRRIVLKGVDAWIAPRLGTEVGVWTSKLCKTLDEFTQSLVDWDFVLSCDSYEECDESTFFKLLEDTEGYLVALKDLDFSAVPNVPPSTERQSASGIVVEFIPGDIRDALIFVANSKYVVTYEIAAWFESLLLRYPDPAGPKAILRYFPECEGIRPNLLRKKLVDKLAPLASLIESTPAGYKLIDDVSQQIE